MPNYAEGGRVVGWLAQLPHNARDLGSIPGLGNSVWNLHVFPVSVWVSSGCSDFPTQSESLVRPIARAKFSHNIPEQAPECGD